MTAPSSPRTRWALADARPVLRDLELFAINRSAMMSVNGSTVLTGTGNDLDVTFILTGADADCGHLLEQLAARMGWTVAVPPSRYYFGVHAAVFTDQDGRLIDVRVCVPAR